MLDTATLLSRIPYVFQTNVYLGVIDMVICYGLIALLIFALRQKPLTWFEQLDNKLQE